MRRFGREGCGRARSIMDSWERGESIAPAELSSVRDHCATCGRCAEELAAILPFIERDVLGEPVAPRPEPGSGFVDSVMESVGRAEPRRRKPMVYVFAAAAAVLLAIGIGSLAYRAGMVGRPDEVLVRFELAAPEAKSVALVGSFTQWEATRLEMRDANGDGVWEVSVRLKKGSVYTYNFLVDGTLWVPDPAAPAQIDDGFGGKSSMIEL